MNKQLSRLLMILLNAPEQYHNYAELAEILSVSSRTVRNYIQTVMQFMETIGLGTCLQISEGGAAFVGTSMDISRIMEEVTDRDFYLYRLSPEERNIMILLYLLLRDDYSNLLELAEKFNVSRTTILKDMEKVKVCLKQEQLRLDPYMKKGYRLMINESRRRDMILRIAQNGQGNVFVANNQVNIYERFLYDEWELEKNSYLLKEILLHTETRFHLEISDIDFEEILLSLQIILKRLTEGRQMYQQENYQVFHHMNAYELAHYVLDQISQRFYISFNEAETVYLASILYGCRFYNRTAMQESKDVRLHLALTRFLYKISEELGLQLLEYDVTVGQLESHLRAIDKVHTEGGQTRNDYTEQMIDEYPKYYELVCQYCFILENVLEYQYTRDDLAVILIYLIVMIEGASNVDDLPKVIVVCHTGLGTANFLAKKLRSTFNIEIVAITSNHKLSERIGGYKWDLIVSTVSLEADPKTWIKVSPVLTDEDILNLQKALMDIRRQKNRIAESKNERQQENAERTFQNAFTSVLDADHVLLDINCCDWIEVIQAAAKPLLDEGLIENQYIEKMIRSVQVNGAYFVYAKGVALVHAGSLDGVNSFGLTLMRLESPVNFGHKWHDPVTYVICMALKEKDYRLQVILKLMDILSNPAFIAELNQIKNVEELLGYLVQHEDI